MEAEIERDEHAQQFVILHNHVARDRTLSRRARGLLAELLSYPPSCKVSFETLLRGGPEKRDVLRAMLRELETAGYITRTKRRDGRGRWQHKLTVRETPKAPSTVEPDVSAGHVQGGFSAGGQTADGKGVDKNSKTETSKNEDLKMASRRAHSSGASANWTVNRVVRDVREAVAQVHGDREADELTDGDALGLFYTYVKSARPHDLVAYVVKILGDAPYLDTFLANVEAACTSCAQWESTCTCPVAA